MPPYGRFQQPQPPLGLYYIKAYIENLGYTVEVQDGNIQKISFSREEIVGIYVCTAIFREAVKLIRQAKAKGKVVVCGGRLRPPYTENTVCQHDQRERF
jgi:radical SAM superfamily enzyme YgiQ (UPF0313 family)